MCLASYPEAKKNGAFQTKPIMKFIVVREAGKLDETMEKLEIKIHYWKKKAGWEDIDTLQALLVHNWAGHIARMQSYRPNSLTARATALRDRRWLLATSSKNDCQKCTGVD